MSCNISLSDPYPAIVHFERENRRPLLLSLVYYIVRYLNKRAIRCVLQFSS